MAANKVLHWNTSPMGLACALGVACPPHIKNYRKTQVNTRYLCPIFYLRLWFAAALVLCALLLPRAWAVAPPANAVISNQAVASFVDGTGTLRTVNSNLVQSTVVQVGAFQLTGSHSKLAALGATIYVQHTLVNHGNGADTFTVTVLENASPGLFTQIAVYSDAEGTGLPSDGTALCSSASAVPCDTRGFSRTLAGNGAEFRFLVAYTAPTHVDGSVASQSAVALVSAEPANRLSGFFASYAPALREQTDTVEFTTGPAFSLTQAIARPALHPAAGNWPEAITSAKAGVSGCATQWSGAMLAANAACTYTVLTMSYTNTGTVTGDLTLQESIPAGLTYVQGSAVWSGMLGSALSEDSIASAQGSGASKIHFSYAADTRVLDATVLGVGPNVSGTISFVVLVNPQARPGALTTTAMARYFSSSCNPLQSGISPSNCGGIDASERPAPPLESNATPFRVLPTYGVVAASIPGAAPDGAPVPAKSGDNLVEQARVTAGEVVLFSNIISNVGDVTDSFNLSVISVDGNAQFPEGTQFQLLRADGLTPLTDNNSDGQPDTGPVEPGQHVEIVLQVRLPQLARIGAGPMEALLSATSIGNGAVPDPRARDAVWNRVNSVQGSLVDLTATVAGNLSSDNATVAACTSGVNCDFGQGPSASPTVILQGHPGVGLVYEFFLSNNDDDNQTYSLSAQLPLGWTIRFLAGENAQCDAPDLLAPVALASRAQMAVRACVTPPSDAALGLSLFRLMAKSVRSSSNGHLVSDSLTYAARLSAPVVRQVSVNPSAASNAVNVGGFIVQSITLTNSGNQSCAVGANAGFRIHAELDSAAQTGGWRTSVYYDKNADGQLDPDDVFLRAVGSGDDANLTDSVAGGAGRITQFSAGGNIKLLLKTQVAANVSLQSRATVTLVVGDRGVPPCPQQFAVYSFSVQNENVRVVKTQVLDPDCAGELANLSSLSSDAVSVAPGQCLIYQVTLHNDGSTPLLDVAVRSSIPVYTSYTLPLNAQPDLQCESGLLSGTPVSYETNMVGNSVGAATCASAGNSLDPAGFVRLTFSVKVHR